MSQNPGVEPRVAKLRLAFFRRGAGILVSAYGLLAAGDTRAAIQISCQTPPDGAFNHVLVAYGVGASQLLPECML